MPVHSEAARIKRGPASLPAPMSPHVGRGVSRPGFGGRLGPRRQGRRALPGRSPGPAATFPRERAADRPRRPFGSAAGRARPSIRRSPRRRARFANEPPLVASSTSMSGRTPSSSISGPSRIAASGVGSVPSNRRPARASPLGLVGPPVAPRRLPKEASPSVRRSCQVSLPGAAIPRDILRRPRRSTPPPARHVNRTWATSSVASIRSRFPVKAPASRILASKSLIFIRFPEFRSLSR